jgi:hypothetical protein
LVAISLIDDQEINGKELGFFKQNPDKGYFLNYVIKPETKGDPLNYSSITRLTDSITYPDWSIG